MIIIPVFKGDLQRHVNEVRLPFEFVQRGGKQFQL